MYYVKNAKQWGENQQERAKRKEANPIVRTRCEVRVYATTLTRQTFQGLRRLLRGAIVKQDQTLLVKIGKYIGFCVYSGSYLL